MKIPFFSKLQAYLFEAYQWFLQTPERALDRAYQAALRIKEIEYEHFGCQKISADCGTYSNSAMSCFRADLNKYLNNAKLRLAEFKASRSVISRTEQNLLINSVVETTTPSYSLEVREKRVWSKPVGDGEDKEDKGDKEKFSSQPTIYDRTWEKPSIIIEKLNLIDETIKKYSDSKNTNLSSSLLGLQKSNIVKFENDQIQQKHVLYQPTSTTSNVVEADTLSEKTGVLPRSIGRTFERIQQDLNPKAEEQVIQKFRNSKTKTLSAIKFILILIIVPILTQQASKNLLVAPLVDQIINPHKAEIFLNIDMEEEALRELQKFEERLKFKNLITQAPDLSKEDMEEEIKYKASEIEEEYRNKSSNAIRNVFADTIALITFCFILVIRKKELQVIKSFIDEIAYDLSDSAKAFMIILFTDMFVGFHSTHGWEVILEGIVRHLGLSENKAFIFLFIATFPVIMDTIFKYWIFRYLSRMSPSAVATYKNMNE